MSATAATVGPLLSRRMLSALVSALLLILVFPTWNVWVLAWVALVPLLRILKAVTPGGAFRWSYLVGLIFFAASMYWLTHLSQTAAAGPAALLGWAALSAYLALYFGIFGYIAVRLGWIDRLGRDLIAPLACAALWVFLEYCRSFLFSGMGWNLLGYSQTFFPPAIQVADMTGAWGVSAIVVLANALLAGILKSGVPHRMRWIYGVVLMAALLACFSYGALRLSQPLGGEPATVRLVQGNIPQSQKWDPAYARVIAQRYERLTLEGKAAAADLVVWPETSIPELIEPGGDALPWLRKISGIIGQPLLAGGAAILDDDTLRNRAVFVSSQSGAVTSHYDKIHLVPLGEFIPFEQTLPWLRYILPPIGGFSPGTEFTIFEATPGLRFGVLICFEDVFPDLARAYMRRGARMLVVITNDAWFGPTAAAYQHAQASAFRAVEMRVPIVRAANTGWSGCIDAYGRWGERVRDLRGKELFVEGSAACTVSLGTTQTFYASTGDWLPWTCLMICLLAAVFPKFRKPSRA